MLYVFRFNHIAGLTITDETKIVLEDWMFGYLQSFKTLLPKVLKYVVDRNNVQMSWTSYTAG